MCCFLLVQLKENSTEAHTETTVVYRLVCYYYLQYRFYLLSSLLIFFSTVSRFQEKVQHFSFLELLSWQLDLHPRREAEAVLRARQSLSRDGTNPAC